jgi:hypothetical protein
VNFLGVYEVIGPRAYRENPPGSRFEARLDRNAEARAVERGSIRLLERVAEDLPTGKYRLPTGWPGTERID